MENSSTYYPDLITKYLSGEITGDEIVLLENWLTSDPDHMMKLEELRKTWILTEQEKLESKLDVEREWNIFREKVKESTKYEVRSTKLKINRILRIAAVILFIAVPSFLLFWYFSKPAGEIITARNQIVETGLPDGTTVILNKGSTIEFSENLTGTKRMVTLEGEACFSVKHDEKSRFFVMNGNVRIEDIGTSFYVNTNRPSGQMEVVLTEGSAAVYFLDNPAGQVIINPGERADIDREGNTILRSVNTDENYMAWKTRKLVFSGNTLPEVIAVLKKVYHADIRLSGNNMNNCRLSATFDNQSLESVLHVIKSTLDISIISKGPYIEISGKNCD